MVDKTMPGPVVDVELMRRLSEAFGPSGQEAEVRDIIKEAVGGHVDEMRVDHLGNLITRKGDPTAPRVMLAAHMDEVGFMINGVDRTGLLRFAKFGIEDRILPSKAVLVGPKRIPGIIGVKPFHLQEPSERERVIGADTLYIDIGAKSKEDAEKHVKLGDYAVFDTKFTLFGSGKVKGRALDDRMGCMVLIETLKNTFAGLNLYGVFTVQEEVGLRGAAVAAYAVEPRYGVVLEGTICSDTPGSEPHQHGTTQGAGPAISLMDQGTVANRAMVHALVRVAEAKGVPYQYRRVTAGGNDAARIHLAHEGAPCCVLSVPCRYIHSPVAVASLEDFANTVRLLGLFLEEIARGGISA
jgi:putative aminopeptidase FrvX